MIKQAKRKMKQKIINKRNKKGFKIKGNSNWNKKDERNEENIKKNSMKDLVKINEIIKSKNILKNFL